MLSIDIIKAIRCLRLMGFLLAASVGAYARSIAVMKRLGMTLDHTAELVHEGETFSAVIYAITRERWQSNIEPMAK